MKNFALTGLAGYIAPRHLNAIKETGNNLIASTDPHDSVGIIDSYFPNSSFFKEYERFDRFLEKQKRLGINLDYLTICSPNYLHDSHIRLGLRLGANVICEKPLVLNPWNLDVLEDMEKEYEKRVWNVLQLRLHPSIKELKTKYSENHKRKKVQLTYITSRGKWYDYSWKGNINKSGGIATNIGIHFFDMLMWLFGEVENIKLNINEENKIGGELILKNADVEWFLSIDENDLPEEVKQKNQRTYRNISIDNEQAEFSNGFTDLHTLVYQDILNGGGFGLNDARPSIELVYKIRNL